ncbi:MAG: SHOCT domain-containing protein [Caldilineales bacterium]|nr:SHOCT domain-containing protein [Caldilineales bacterium]
MMNFGFGGFGLIFMILFWVLIIAGAVWLISRLFPQTTGSATPHSGGGHIDPCSSPEEILKRRYAQGEISTTEFQEMRQQLR